jgi:hypothetical protein
MMKKFLIACIAGLTACISIAQSPKLAVFYINGIQNTPYEANASARSLQTVISPLIDGSKVNSIYNPIGFYGGALKPNADTKVGCVTFEESTGKFIYYASVISPQAAVAAIGITTLLAGVTGEDKVSQNAGCVVADLAGC